MPRLPQHHGTVSVTNIAAPASAAKPEQSIPMQIFTTSLANRQTAATLNPPPPLASHQTLLNEPALNSSVKPANASPLRQSKTSTRLGSLKDRERQATIAAASLNQSLSKLPSAAASSTVKDRQAEYSPLRSKTPTHGSAKRI